MHTATDKQAGNMMGVAIVAATIGAVAALLLAPKRGSEMRDDLKGRYRDIKHKAKTKADDMEDKVSEGVEEARSKAKDTVDKAKDKIDDMADEADEPIIRRRM